MIDKKELLFRRNRGKLDLPDVIEQLNYILNKTIYESDFLGLEESDKIIANYYEKYKTSPKVISEQIKSTSSEFLKSIVIKAATITKNEEVYYISKFSENCGVIKSESQCLFDHFQELIELDGDSFCISGVNLNSGVMIDYFSEYVDDVETFFYEVSVWGYE